MSKVKVDTKVARLNSEELKEFISYIINNNRVLQSTNKLPVSLNIEGQSGIGKTSIILQIAEEHNLDCVRLNLAELEELGDLVGFPIKEYKVVSGDTEKWIPENTISNYLSLGYTLTDEKRMSYAPPEWIQNKKRGGILILDDYTRADSRFMQACMTLIETQKYGSWTLPKDWHIILTTNPDDGSYLVTSLDDAQKTRFVTVYMKFDVHCWARWAETQNIDTRCINFLLLYPELVKDGKNNARSITTFFNLISSIDKFDGALSMIRMLGDGSVGLEFCQTFISFINNKLDSIISPYDIYNKDWEVVKEKILSATQKGNELRADVSSVIATRLINYSLLLSTSKQNGGITPNIIERLNLIINESLFNNEIEYYIINNIINSKGKKFDKLMTNSKVQKAILK